MVDGCLITVPDSPRLSLVFEPRQRILQCGCIGTARSSSFPSRQSIPNAALMLSIRVHIMDASRQQPC